MTTPAELAQRFHETYERLAPAHGYQTREASAVPWDEVPDKNRSLMIAVCRELMLTELLEARAVTAIVEDVLYEHLNPQTDSEQQRLDGMIEAMSRSLSLALRLNAER